MTKFAVNCLAIAVDAVVVSILGRNVNKLFSTTTGPNLTNKMVLKSS